MKNNQLSHIIDLMGGGLQCEFGNLESVFVVNRKREQYSVMKGIYTLSIFDCSWRVRKNGKIIFSRVAVDSYKNFLPLLVKDEALFLNEIYYASYFDLSLRFSNDIQIDIFMLSNNDEKDPCLFCDREDNTLSDDLIMKYGILKTDIWKNKSLLSGSKPIFK